MPEGPSIVILKEEVRPFTGKKVLEVGGNAKADLQRMRNKTIVDFKSWGKQFFICFNGFFARIHLLLFGSYRINERKETPARLSLRMKNGELNFYNCSVRILEGDPGDLYDYERDTMSDTWSEKKALVAVRSQKDEMVCDVIMNQEIFAGAGNIIKNEVLFRIGVHPETVVKALPAKKVRELVKDVRAYCFLFYKWKKMFELKRHWLIYRSSTCPRCGQRVLVRPTGKGERRSFFCTNCQLLYKR